MSKPKAPPPPDYAAAAQATAAGNLAAAREQTAANRVNQVTPYGSLTYSQTPTPGTFDQAGYDRAMQEYQARQTQATNAGALGGPLGNVRQRLMAGNAPSREAFTRPGSTQWTATQTLDPEQQRILEANTRLQQGLLGTAEQGLGKVSELLSNPTIDESRLAQMPISGQSVQDAIMSRLQPNLDRQREQLRTQLANQGITMGSEAFQGAMRDQSQRENDLMTQAALQGIGTGLTARQQGLQEQTYMQDRPLNVINSLRTGNQVTGPQFVNPAQQSFAPGADLLGAAQNQYGAQMGAYNAQQAGQGNMLNGLFGLAGAAMPLFF